MRFSSYWPGIATAPEDPGNRAVSEENRRVSRAYNTLPKVVVSDTFAVPAGNAWQGTTSVIPGWEGCTQTLSEGSCCSRHAIISPMSSVGSGALWGSWIACSVVPYAASSVEKCAIASDVG